MMPSSFDTVFVDTLHLSATIGPDCWGKTRPQPLSISVYLNLEPKYLVASGETDEVEKSVHYGLLTKKVTSLIRKKNEEDGWDGVDALVRDVAEEAFELGSECVQSVRVVVEVPKVILLASSYTVDTTLLVGYDEPNVPTTLQPSIRRPRERRLVAKKVEVKEVVVPVIIGVNPPERLAKQKVMTDLVFHERVGEDSVGHVRYGKVVDALVKNIEASAYLTLEKFVHELARAAFSAEKRIEGVTVRARKPSALSFADFSGVEVTRRRQDYAL